MAFFKFEKTTKTEDLKLSDYDKIWTKFCFLDETGSLSDLKNPYFTIGIIKISQPYYLQSKILYERSRMGFYDEMKFNRLSKNNITFAKFVVDAILAVHSTDFYSYTISKQSEYFIKSFHANPWRAYEQITLKLLDAALSNQEILILIADHVTTPKDVRFEVATKRDFNKQYERLALAGVCRFDSRSNDLLQIVDLLIGAVTYDIKFSKGMVSGSVYKKEFVEYFKQRLGTTNFLNGFRNKQFNIFVDRSKNS